MKREYILVSSLEGNEHREVLKNNFSSDWWLKRAKQDEKEGCFVDMTFKYDSSTKQLVMTSYRSFNSKTRVSLRITLKK